MQLQWLPSLIVCRPTTVVHAVDIVRLYIILLALLQYYLALNNIVNFLTANGIRPRTDNGPARDNRRTPVFEVRIFHSHSQLETN